MRALLMFACLVSAVAAAQITPCGNAVCVGNNPQDVNLGGTLVETRGPRADGGLAILQPVVPGATLQLQSVKPTGTPGTPDIIIGAGNKHDGGTLVSVRNGNQEVATISASGAITATSFSGSGGTGQFAVIDAGYGLINGQFEVKGPLYADTNLSFNTGSVNASGTSIYQISSTIMGFGTGGAAAWTIQNVGGTPSLVPANAGSSICDTGAASCIINGTTGTFSSSVIPQSSTNHGLRFMDAGTQTVTVVSGANCICQDVTDGTKSCRLPVSGTTATFGNTTNSDTVSYHCF